MMLITVAKGVAGGRRLEIEIAEDASVKAVKDELRCALGVPAEQMRLVWQDTALDDEGQFAHYGVGPGACITLVVLQWSEIAKGKHPLVGQVLTAMSAGKYNPESLATHGKCETRLLEVTDEELDARIGDAFGGFDKPDATKARFVELLGYLFSKFETFSCLECAGGYRTSDMATLKQQLYTLLVQHAVVTAQAGQHAESIVTPVVTEFGSVCCGIRFCCSSGRRLFSEELSRELMRNDVFSAPARYQDSEQMFYLMRVRVRHLDPRSMPPQFLLHEEEVLPLLHAQADLCAGVCPVLIHRTLAESSIDLLSCAMGWHYTLLHQESLEFAALQADIKQRLVGASLAEPGISRAGPVLVVVFVAEIPGEANADHVRSLFIALREGCGQPLQFIVCKRA